MDDRPTYLLPISLTLTALKESERGRDGLGCGNSHRPRSFQFVIGRLWKSLPGSRALLASHTSMYPRCLSCVCDLPIIPRHEGINIEMTKSI